MRTLLLIAAILFVLFPSETRQQACAQSNPDLPMTVSADWLKQHKDISNLVLLHVGARDEYDAGHIAGAQYISLRELSLTSEESDLSLQLAPADRLKAVFERLGVGNDSRIVVYFGKDWVSPTTRVYFTLDYLGLSNHTSILDGGMPAWVAAGGGLTKDVATPKPGSLTVTGSDPLVVTADWVKANFDSSSVRIIDARDAVFYEGTNAGGMPRAGHIKNAKSIPFSTVVGDNDKFKSPDELKKMFESVGVKPYDTVVTYCHIGQQASVDYFAAKMAGYKVKLYDGSFQEWSRLADAPVENPAGDRPATTVSLVSPKWLEEHAGDANVRILDVRQNVYDYFAGHALNSVHLADPAMRFPAEGIPTQYPETFMIGMLFSRAGVKKGDRVAIYSDGDGVLGATMIAYMLERIGQSDIVIVDGGWRDYKASQKVSQEYPSYKPASVDVLDNIWVRASLADVRSNIGKAGVKFIDARPPDVYRGETKIWARNGHIPGAINIPWKQLVEENNSHKLKALEEMRAVYAANGITANDDIIVYCGTSREASLEYFVLKHLLKYPKVRLFEGSWAEYSAQADVPIETGAAR